MCVTIVTTLQSMAVQRVRCCFLLDGVYTARTHDNSMIDVMTDFTFEPRIARRVKADSLEPRQHPTSRKLKIATDFRQRFMLKHPFLSCFHSRAEYLHAGLLEGTPSVISYVPQPYRLRVGKMWYIPDFHVMHDGSPREVEELKPRGELDDDLRVPLEQFFAQHRMRFVVVSNESIYERETEAENWIEIVSILHVARTVTTTDAEQIVLESIYKQGGSCTLGEIIDAGDRERTYLLEIALFRLLHQGHLRSELTERPIDYDTVFSRCV
jgi:hypothetical protein